MQKKWFLTLVAAVLSAGAGMAKAESILDNETAFTVTGSGPYTYNYTIELTSNSVLSAGDFFEIVDFRGFTGTASHASLLSWDFSSPLFTGSVTNGTQTISVPDSGAISNLRWTYRGADLVNTTGAALVLGLFSAESTLGPGPLGNGDLMAKDATISGALRVNGDNPTVPVPLPAAAWGGLGLLGMIGAARVRKARKA